MANYLLVYYGGTPESDPQKVGKVMEAWVKWFQELGQAVIDPGAPTIPGKTITDTGIIDGINGEHITGYTILKARSMESAAAMAKNSPILKDGGRVSIYEIIPTSTRKEPALAGKSSTS